MPPTGTLDVKKFLRELQDPRHSPTDVAHLIAEAMRIVYGLGDQRVPPDAAGGEAVTLRLVARVAWALDDVNHRTGLRWRRLCDWNERLITGGRCECGDPRDEHDAGIASCGMCPCQEYEPEREPERVGVEQ